MAFPDKPTDTDLPKPFSSLSDWRFFFAATLGIEHPTYDYLDELCNRFGVDFEVTIDPNVFKSHIIDVASTNAHEAYLKSREIE